MTYFHFTYVKLSIYVWLSCICTYHPLRLGERDTRNMSIVYISVCMLVCKCICICAQIIFKNSIVLCL